MGFFQVFRPVLLLTGIIFFGACDPAPKETNSLRDGNLVYEEYSPQPSDLVISRSAYLDKLYGFWLGENIGNWTGLVTEMDKIGNIGEIQTGDFYTREDWGSPDLPSVFGEGVASDLSDTIDFVLRKEGEVWGSDDDTDIEYMYQYLLYTNQTSILTPVQIREGWLKHIKSEEENYLWVSNQTAFNLMEEGILPPLTGDPMNNKHFDMIDAQLTTEIFGLFAPARPDIALELANLPIQTTARNEAQKIAEFYVIMYSLASKVDSKLPMKDRLMWMSKEARKNLPADSYLAKMYDFVFDQYVKGAKWESTRDSLYVKYQVNQEDGYAITSKNLYCNGCFAAGINFGASMVSLLYGEGDLKETIKIGALSGWDSDNPTATWAGLIGFMLGGKEVQKQFGGDLSEQFNIHRTRQNFPNDGLDTFENMAKVGVYITDRAVQEVLGGGVDLEKDVWYVPLVKK